MDSVLLTFVVLFGITNAQYVAFTEWYWNGCNNMADNTVYDLNIYYADGRCFTPLSGGVLYSGYGYRITSNSTHVITNLYPDSLCSGDPYFTDYYPLDGCYSYYSTQLFSSVPSAQYWISQNLTGSYDGHWDTVIASNYFYDGDCNSATWREGSVYGFSLCDNGQHTYCQDNAVHQDWCSNATCDDPQTCVASYQPLGEQCQTISWDWSNYVSSAAPSETVCAQSGPASPSPLPSSSPTSWVPSSSASPSSDPSAAPTLPPSDSSSSDGPSDGVWILLMIICFLVGVIVGLLVGLAFISKNKSRNQVNPEYIPLPAFGTPVAFIPAPEQ